MFKLNLIDETFSTATLETDKQHQDHFALPYHALYENKMYELDISYPPTYAYDMMHNNINPTLIVCHIERKSALCPIVISNISGAHPLSKNPYKIDIRYYKDNLTTREIYEQAFEIIDEFNACVHKWFPQDQCLDLDIMDLIHESWNRKFI